MGNRHGSPIRSLALLPGLSVATLFVLGERGMFENRPIMWFGAIALIAIVGFFLMRIVFEPSEIETRAFLRTLLLAEGRVHALGADGSVIRLDAARIIRVDAAKCAPDRNEVLYGGRHVLKIASRFVCRYTVVTAENARFETVLRADRVPPGGPAERPIPGSPFDPSRYREGSFILSSVGLGETESLLAPSSTR
jgi:hypothetical protein